MNKGGIAVRLINLAKLITGRAPGALAQTNILANMLFGSSFSGSGTAAASAMGSIIGPIQREEGYDPNFSAAVNIATAPTGLLIPPSNVYDHVFTGQWRNLRSSAVYGWLYSWIPLGIGLHAGGIHHCKEKWLSCKKCIYCKRSRKGHSSGTALSACSSSS